MSTSRRSDVCIVGSFGHGNLGDDLLQRLITDVIRRHDSQRAVHSLSLGRVTDPPSELPTHALRLRDPVGSARRLLRVLPRSKLLVIGPGGLVSSAFPGTVAALASLACLFRAAGARVALIGIGVDPLPDVVPNSALAALVKAADWITVRDEASLAALPSSVRRAQVGGDLAWRLSLPERRAESSGLVVSVRPWPEWDADRLLDGTAAAVRRYLDSYPAHPVHLLSMDRRRDPPILRALQARIGNHPTVIDVPRTPEEALPILSNATAVLAMRFHAALLAAKAGRPLCVIPYAPKLDALASGLGLPVWQPASRQQVRFAPPDAERVRAQVASAVIHEEALIQALEAT